jgi:nucleotide-binding universal stress UspA family protein
MSPFTRILVDLDAIAAVHPAVDRAIELARHCGARVKLVDTVSVPPSARGYLPAAAEEVVYVTRRANLAKLAGAVEGVPVDVEVLTGRPAEAIIAEVVAGGHDLVIRSHARDLAAGPRSLGAIDMQLFRSCPCTVWAVGPGARSAPRTVVAAVHSSPGDPEEQKLNARIIETARLMAAAGQGHPVIFEAWHAFAEDMLRSHYAPDEMAAYVQAAGDSAKAELDALVASVPGGPANESVELRKGNPEEVLPELVVSEGIDLVVLGTVARTGVAGLIMGNTAERLLQRLPCSVMAVKPEGFRAPGA